jgi:energy-converting hydrogenase Eha subunit G
MGIGALIGSLVAMRARPRRPLVLAGVAYGLFVFPLAFLAAGAPVVVIAFGALMGGVAMMLGNSVWESTLQARVPVESLSRVSAYDWFGSMAFSPLGMAIWGPIAGLIGIHTALWLAAALVFASTGALLSVPAIRALQA